MNNFFGWCADTLSHEESELSNEKFFALTSLIFEEDRRITFNMKKVIALSTLLALSALGMACGGDTATNNAAANANKAVANAMNAAANAMNTAANTMANAANSVANAANAATNAAKEVTNASNAAKKEEPKAGNTNAAANANHK